MNYEPVIGLEVHVELATASKMFCRCSADYFGKEPNTHVCGVCLGLPGALPVANIKAIDWCIAIGLALNCEIPYSSKFDRKNYFYPDLSKGYQISQYNMPFCINGSVTLKNGKKIKIQRAHMEEDTAKLTHATVDRKKVSLIDFNRSGIPLVEIVTAPDFENSEQVVEYLKALQQIVRYLGVSNADMEKGDMRLEPNVSLRKETKSKRDRESKLPSYKVELKNINSFRFVEKAIRYEIKRQSEILDRGDTPNQETRGWNENKNETVSQRTKEYAHDYRYFPEPDLPPFVFDQKYIDSLKVSLSEMPDEKRSRFLKKFQLSSYDVEILTRDVKLANFFEEAVKVGKKYNINAKQIANAIINKKPDIDSILPTKLVQNILASTQNSSLNQKELEEIVKQVIVQNPKAVEDYKKGKETVIMFLIGQVQKMVQGAADPANTKKIIIEKLKPNR